MFTHFPKETFRSRSADGLFGEAAPLIQWTALVTGLLASSTIRNGLRLQEVLTLPTMAPAPSRASGAVLCTRMGLPDASVNFCYLEM